MLRRWCIAIAIVNFATSAAAYDAAAARSRLTPHFRSAGVSYPPKRVALLAFKDERTLSLWAGDAQAAADRRTRLGGDIFIHGNAVSIGCIAVGDVAIEERFTLVADAGVAQTTVIIAPTDLRTNGAPVAPDAPLWVGRLYADITRALAKFPQISERRGRS